MNWREILGMSPSAETSYTHNSHNTQKYPETTHCADIADSAYRDSEQENAQLPGALAIATLSLAGGACWGNRRMISSTLSHYVLRARSYVVIINTLFYKGILR